MATTILLLCLATAADGAGDDDQERREAVARIAPAKAMQVEMRIGETVPRALALVEKPLLRWSNPTAGSVFGEVFLWTDGGRPVAIASIYRWYHPFKDSTVEVVSITDQPVTAREGERVYWESPAGAASVQALPTAPAPAATAAARLSQMRAIAREFSAELADARGGENVARALRLLNQPVYRYASDVGGVIDGGLFAFVESTDPEAWLMLEAVHASEQRTWRYAVARMNADGIAICRAEQEVASWPKIVQPWRYRAAPYTTFGFDPDLVKLKPVQP